MSEPIPEPEVRPAPPSGSRLAPLIALAVVAVVTVAVVLAVVLAGPGTLAVKSGKVTVHYAGNVTRGKAQRLARYLEVEEIGGGKEVEARLSRDADGDGKGWVVDLFVTKTPQLAKDPQFHGLVRLLHDIIRSRILKVDHLRLRVCDRLDLEERLSGRKEPVPWKEVGP